MKLNGDLKKSVEAAASKEEARAVIAEAGMELTPDELDQVSGGHNTMELIKAGPEQLEQWRSMADGEVRVLSGVSGSGEGWKAVLTRNGDQLRIDALMGGAAGFSIYDCSPPEMEDDGLIWRSIPTRIL